MSRRIYWTEEAPEPEPKKTHGLNEMVQAALFAGLAVTVLLLIGAYLLWQATGDLWPFPVALIVGLIVACLLVLYRMVEYERDRGLEKKERELKGITSEAYRQAQEIVGRADAEATRIYAEAYNQDPDFYRFIKTLETYSDTLDEESWLILTTEGEFFHFLKGVGGK